MKSTTIDKYLKYVNKIEQLAQTRWYYYVNNNFIIEVSICEHNLSNPNDLMNIWKKCGFIDEVKDTHINIKTFYTNEKGECIGRYNITLRRKGTRQVINFDYLLDATDKNIKLLVAECVRLYVKGERLQNAYA